MSGVLIGIGIATDYTTGKSLITQQPVRQAYPDEIL
jgi:hypothetical protein